MRLLLNKWPCIRASVEIIGGKSLDDLERQDNFREGISCLFDRFGEAFGRLAEEEKAGCGLCGVAADVSIKIDMQKREVVLDRLYKYCALDFHLFTELLRILQSNFFEYILIVPSLRGFELAREIQRFLGTPRIECIYLKSNLHERLVSGKSLPEDAFSGILRDTARHYEAKGEAEKEMHPSQKHLLDIGREMSMYFWGSEGEEEVLWMSVKIPLSNRP